MCMCSRRDLVKGDFARTATYMSAWTGCTAILEFLLNPTIGGISDTIGRKPLMLMGPYFAVVLKTWCVMHGHACVLRISCCMYGQENMIRDHTVIALQKFANVYRVRFLVVFF